MTAYWTLLCSYHSHPKAILSRHLKKLLELLPENSASKTVERKRGIDYEARLDRDGVILYRKLRALRAEIAARKRVPPYIVFMNRSLYEMCVSRPGTIEELQNLYGVGKKNSADYGEEFLEVIHKYSSGEDPAIADQTAPAPSAAPLSVAEELSHFAVSKATG